MLLLRMLNSPFCFLKTVGHINKAFSKMTIALPASVSVRACTKLSFTSKGVYNSRRRLLSCKPVACAQDMANQSYPQTVNLDEGKARAAEIQSEQSKAQGGVTTPTDEASKARVRSVVLCSICMHMQPEGVHTSVPLRTACCVSFKAIM